MPHQRTAGNRSAICCVAVDTIDISYHPGAVELTAMWSRMCRVAATSASVNRRRIRRHPAIAGSFSAPAGRGNPGCCTVNLTHLGTTQHPDSGQPARSRRWRAIGRCSSTFGPRGQKLGPKVTAAQITRSGCQHADPAADPGRSTTGRPDAIIRPGRPSRRHPSTPLNALVRRLIPILCSAATSSTIRPCSMRAARIGACATGTAPAPQRPAHSRRGYRSHMCAA